jgi:hypothetical protein
MRAPIKSLVGAALLLALALPAQAEVPQTIGFTARLVDDKTGDELTGSHQLSFKLFAAATGGTALWTENVTSDVEEGLLFVDLGSTEPLTATVLDGRKLFLEVTLDGVVMDPRVTLGSVPYAVRATEAANAATVGGVAVDQLQRKITGGCTAGNFIIGINEDGSAACAPDLSGSGDITEVTAGDGLTGGGAAGNVTLSLVDCGQNEVLKFVGAVWTCAADANSGGDITGVTVGGVGGLSGGGASGDVQLSLLSTCANGQILRFNGTWACSNDLDTNSGGTLTAVTTSGNSGLVSSVSGSTVALSLLTSCSNNQVLKFNAGTGAWGCANDNDVDTNSGGDVTEVVGGAGLAATNQTGPIVTLDIGAGAGIIVGANTVSLDTDVVDLRVSTIGDPRYVNTAGDTMSGSLDLGGNLVTNRGCPSGYVKHGATCLENADIQLSFSLCANKCRGQNAHICSSGEIRAVMQSGITIGGGGVAGDWADDMDSITNVFVIASGTDSNSWATFAQTTTTNFCRCCTDVE